MELYPYCVELLSVDRSLTRGLFDSTAPTELVQYAADLRRGWHGVLQEDEFNKGLLYRQTVRLYFPPGIHN